MFANLNVFSVSSAKASYASARQNVTSRNIAHSDTPNYKALELFEFSDSRAGIAMRVPLEISSAKHQFRVSQGSERVFATREKYGEPSLNGNTVSLEAEILMASKIKHDHDIAVSTYKTGLGIVRSVLGKAR